MSLFRNNLPNRSTIINCFKKHKTTKNITCKLNSTENFVISNFSSKNALDVLLDFVLLKKSQIRSIPPLIEVVFLADQFKIDRSNQQITNFFERVFYLLFLYSADATSNYHRLCEIIKMDGQIEDNSSAEIGNII